MCATPRRDHTMYWPPLTDIVDPVMPPASSAARNTTARAISSGSPRRLTGISGRMLFSSTSFGTACTNCGIDVARADRVHGDAAPGVLQRQGLGEADVAGLSGRIIDLAELALLAVDRGDVDDAAKFAGAHALDHLTCHVEQRAEIGVDDRIPLIDRHLVERAVLGDAGIVDQHLDRTDLGLDLFHAFGAGLERRHIPFVNGNAGL